MRILALVNARAGSRGVPGKNIKPLGGKPLLAWTLQAARQSKTLTDIVLSTEDEGIAAVGRAHGAEVPFLRPAQLAADNMRQVDVALFVLGELAKKQRAYDLLVLLQPTSPFRRPADIDATITAAVDGKSDCAFTVSPVEDSHHPAYYVSVGDGRAKPLLNGLTGQRQGFPAVYRRNGAVYAVTSDMLHKTNSFHRPGAPVHVMPSERSVNIDTPIDWAWAEFLLERGHVSA